VSRRRQYRPEWAEHLAGVAATFDRDCAACPEPILVNQRIVRTGRGWVHVACAAGWRDE
jgi:hypothetical protein